MEDRKNLPKQVKVEIRRSPNALKIALIILILCSTATLVALRWVQSGIREQIREKTAEAAELEHANEKLTEKIENIDSVQSIQEIARDELGLVDPDTVVIDPQ
ncbi:MAG: septum formation initiator family protein [Oscillospiraceae bacterium]|nr:septum formation initiator family protein [Oscillospiraceae bacterium]